MIDYNEHGITVHVQVRQGGTIDSEIVIAIDNEVKWPSEMIVKNLPDPSGERVPTMRRRFLDVERIEINQITQTSHHQMADCSITMADGSIKRGVFLWKVVRNRLKLVAAPLVG